MKNKRNGWTSPQGILGALLLVLGLVIVGPQAWACLCECYWSSDCSDGERCGDYFTCTKVDDPNSDDPKKMYDGLCKKRGSVAVDQQLAAAQALDIWLEAFQTAGANGGGEPDRTVLKNLEGVALSEDQHADIREVALGVVARSLGYTSYPDEMHANPGFFSPPLFVAQPGPQPCSNYAEYIDNGVVAALDQTHLGVLSTIRDGAVAELIDPGKGLLEAALTEIPKQYPNYVTVGSCEYPSWAGERFPYDNGFDCLNNEVRANVQSILAQRPNNKLTLRQVSQANAAP